MGKIAFLGLFLLPVFFAPAASAADACRDKIERSIYLDRQRTSDEKYVGPFLRSYDLYPKPLKSFLCKFDSFTIRPMTSTADSSMSFRRGLFEQDIDFSRWASWKEQLTFGVPNSDEFTVRSDLPQVETSFREPGSWLHLVLAHEAGHNVPGDGSAEWQALYRAPMNQIPYRDRFCFYRCPPTPNIPLADVPDFYAKLYGQTTFLTAYAGTNYRDDWAEAFAFYVMMDIVGMDYRVVMPDGTRYDVKELLHSPRFAPKLKLIQAAYARLKDAQPLHRTLEISAD